MSYGRSRGQRLGVMLAAGLVGAGVLPVTAASAAVDTEAFCANVSGENPFSDVEASDVHYDNILCLSTSGITKGVTATTYAPGEGTTRGQMASFIARMVDRANDLQLTNLEELTNQPADAFPDDEGNTHEGAINRLAAAGIVEGKTDGSYHPDEIVSRAQMASYIARALEHLTGEALDAGSDAFPDDEGSVHEANIDKLAALAVVEGKTDGSYHPDEQVNRSQMASYIIRALSALQADGSVTPLPAPLITLAEADLAQGGTVNGTIANPTTIENLSADGCGVSLADVSVNGATGGFSIKLPPDFAGDCLLRLAASWTDGSSTTQAFNLVVSAADLDITDAPDLIATTYVFGTNQALFHFDEEVTSILPGAAGQFHLYAIDGSGLSAVAADIRPEDHTTVVATFDGNLLPTRGFGFTRAGLDKNTVEDAEGNLNYPDFAVIYDQLPGITTAPDLLWVDNIRTDSLSRIVADFTFDQTIDQGAVNVQAFFLAEQSTAPQQAGAIAPGLFGGQSVIDFSDDGRTVTVQFGSTAGAPTPNTSQIARGIVEAGAVIGTDAFPTANVLQVEPACVGGGPVGTCTSAANGTATGRTDTPDLVSAVPGGNNSLRVTFDEPVDPDAPGLNPAAFVAYQGGAGGGQAALSVQRSATDVRVVDVDFPSPLTDYVILTVEDGDNGNSAGPGVIGTTGEQLPNIDDEVAIGAASAGTTALADLLGVTARQLPNGGWVVEYLFDSAPGPAGPLGIRGIGDFYIVDPEGTLTPNTGGVVVGNSVIITTDETTATALGLDALAPAAVGFDVSDIDDSIIGSVDDTHPGQNLFLTEGEATLVKIPLA